MTAARAITEELGVGRDFEVYAQGMDASLQQKLQDILPWVKPGKIVDKGCGTGRTLAALGAILPGTKLRGVDLSPTFVELARKNAPEALIRQRSATDGMACHDNTATTVIFSSVLHEVYSYAGYSFSQVTRALRRAWHELKYDGHVIIRDGVSPPPAMWNMRFLTEEARLWFIKFAAEFKHRRGLDIEWVNPMMVRLSSHDANEFLVKKDYHKNWDIEVNEEFGIFTRDTWLDAVHMHAGFKIVHVELIRNPWIIKHRYEGQVWLTDADTGRDVTWPATNILIVGRKV